MKAQIELMLRNANVEARNGLPYHIGYAQAIADVLKAMDGHEAEINRVKMERHCTIKNEDKPNG